MNDKKLSALNVAVMYVGAIMGAGFASGRETWQFFGVFGYKGIIGALIFAVVFLITGHVIRCNAKILKTNDMGKIIVPGGNKKLESFVGYFMAAILALVMVIMTAAGGALLNQQFGFNYYVGGIVITVLVIATVIGDFERISRVFKYIMPVLCIAMILTCIVVVGSKPEVTDHNAEIVPSPVAPNWFIASILYVSYNVMALISIVATSTLNAMSDKTAVIGTTMGGVFLGILAMLILITVQCDPAFSQMLDMPVLGYADRVSKALGYVYTLILFFAIYSAATSNFYGFTTKIKEGPNKNKKIIAAAVISFILGLVGFKNIVSYVSPLIGYLGIIIIIMLFANYIVLNKDKKNLR